MNITDRTPGDIKPRANGNKNSGTVYTDCHKCTFIFKYKGAHKEVVHIEKYDEHGNIIGSIRVPKTEFNKPLREMNQHDFDDVISIIPLWFMKYGGKKND